MVSLQSSICLRLLLFFHVVNSCMAYLIGQREKCHSRLEVGLWKDWTLGFDEPPRHKGNRKLMKSHHMERLYRQTLMGMPVRAEDIAYIHYSVFWAIHLLTGLQLIQVSHEGTHAKVYYKCIQQILQKLKHK